MNKQQSYKHDWYVRNGSPASSKIRREQRHFDGRRELILYRDERCQRCGGTHQLLVHHQDGNGRGNPNPNNDPWNLKTLCRACHMEVHRAELQAARGFVSSTGWAPKYGLDACSQCGSSERAHAGLGLCANCLQLKRRREAGVPPPRVGDAHQNSTLTNAQVIEIYLSPDPAPVLAKRFGLTAKNIGRIKRNQRWQQTTLPYRDQRPPLIDSRRLPKEAP